MKYETAGDPISGLRWTRKTTEKIADELSVLDIRVSRKTVAKLLKQMNFSLRTNKKKISNGSRPDRDAVVSKNTNELKIGTPRRFVIDVYPVVSKNTNELKTCAHDHAADPGIENGTPVNPCAC